jgi:TonB family protein
VSFLGPSLRRLARPRRRGPRLLAALAASLLANLLLASRLDLSWLDRESVKARSVSLAALSARDWEANRRIGGVAPRTRLTPPPAAVEQPRLPEPSGQVVRIAPPIDPPKEPPRDARFLAEHDSAVEKETRSRHAANENKNRLPVPQGKAGAAPGLPEARPGAGARRAPPPRPAERDRRVATAYDPSGELRLREPAPGAAPPEAREQGREGREPGTGKPPGLPGAPDAGPAIDLRPSLHHIETAAGGPASDHLAGVEEGEATFLNTRQWKYAGYFNRMSDLLDDQWVREGRSAVAARDPTGQRFLYKDRVAVIDVTLDDHGAVKQVRVARSTGVDFLDRVAVDMFRKAEVFPNPPPGIVDARGEINFAFGINFVGVSPHVGLFRAPSPR